MLLYISDKKASGPDKVKSSVVKGKEYSPMTALAHQWINGKLNYNPWKIVKKSRLILLSKKGQKIPPAKNLRPIGVA